MIRVRRILLSAAALLLVGLALPVVSRAQTTSVPALTQALPAQSLAAGGAGSTLDLRNHFNVPGITATVVQFSTDLGRFNVQMLPADAPASVTNFLSYVADRAYNGTIIHRSIQFTSQTGFGIIQGGGYTYALPPAATAKKAPIALEYKLPNALGTLAMARTSEANSATSEWFFNTSDNSSVFGPSNGGGYAVFGRILGTGTTVTAAINSLLPYNVGSPFTDIPLRNIASGQTNVQLSNFIQVSSVAVASVYPTGTGVSILTFSVTSSDAGVATGSVTDSTLTVTPVSGGTATLTVRATDTNGNVATGNVTVTVSGTFAVPVFITQPVAQTVASGTTVVFSASASGSPTYQWKRDGTDIAGATSATLVLNAVTAAQAGNYTVVAKNDTASVTSSAAALTVRTAPASDLARLINLSIRTKVVTGTKTLTVGAVAGPLGLSGTLPLVMRAVGPGLTTYGVTGVLPDPTMEINKTGATATLIATNDNWGTGDATLATAFRNVGAFDLSQGSLDSAYLTPAPGVGVGGYTVVVNGKGSASGEVLAEIYDAVGSARTATTPRLINLSTLSQVDTGGDMLVGFVLRGTPTNPLARTLLIRAVGPSLAALEVGNVMADPKVELFDNDHGGVKLAENDNWGGDAAINAVITSVGAFALSGPATKDAVLVVTLPPGAYSARLSGVGGAGGNAIIEVYEVP